MTSVIEKILSLTGCEKNRKFEAMNTGFATKIIALKYQLACNRGDRQASPLHQAAQKAGIDTESATLHRLTLPIVDDAAISLDIVCGNLVAVLLPLSAASAAVASVYASLCRHAMRRDGHIDPDDKTFVLIEYNPKMTKYRYSTIAANGAAQDESLYNAFVTAMLTNEELDFDLEVEMASLRDRSRCNRQRIKAKMKSLGLKVLRGRKADVYLRHGGRKVSVDIDLLARQFPEAYRCCCTEAHGYEYISLKLHA